MTHLPTDAAAQPGDLIAHIEKPTQGELSDAVGKIVRSVQGRRTRSRIVSTVTELVANLEEHGPERDDGPFGEVAVYQIDEPEKPQRKTIRHAWFNEAWLLAGEGEE